MAFYGSSAGAPPITDGPECIVQDFSMMVIDEGPAEQEAIESLSEDGEIEDHTENGMVESHIEDGMIDHQHQLGSMKGQGAFGRVKPTGYAAPPMPAMRPDGAFSGVTISSGAFGSGAFGSVVRPMQPTSSPSSSVRGTGGVYGSKWAPGGPADMGPPSRNYSPSRSGSSGGAEWLADDALATRPRQRPFPNNRYRDYNHRRPIRSYSDLDAPRNHRYTSGNQPDVLNYEDPPVRRSRSPELEQPANELVDRGHAAGRAARARMDEIEREIKADQLRAERAFRAEARYRADKFRPQYRVVNHGELTPPETEEDRVQLQRQQEAQRKRQNELFLYWIPERIDEFFLRKADLNLSFQDKEVITAEIQHHRLESEIAAREGRLYRAPWQAAPENFDDRDLFGIGLGKEHVPKKDIDEEGSGSMLGADTIMNLLD